MKAKRQPIVSYHAIQRYLERVEQSIFSLVLEESEICRVRANVLDIVEHGRLLETDECALFVKSAAVILGGDRSRRAPSHWGHYYYDESRGAIAVLNHQCIVTTVLVPTDKQLEYLHRLVVVDVCTEPMVTPPRIIDRRGESLEICISDGCSPAPALVTSWIGHNGYHVPAVWMDTQHVPFYKQKTGSNFLPELGQSVAQPSIAAIWFLRELLDKELFAPKRVLCKADWALFILLSLMGQDCHLPDIGLSFSPGTVYAVSLSDKKPVLTDVYLI